MKQVLNELPKVTAVLSTAVSLGKYYGVQMDASQRGFVTRERYGKGNFVLRSMVAVTSGNGWNYENSSLPALIAVLLADENSVFEFDNAKELLVWLSKDS